jgi:hypothetical protein
MFAAAVAAVSGAAVSGVAVSGVAGVAVSGAAGVAVSGVAAAAAHAGDRAAFAKLRDLADELRRNRPWSISLHCCAGPKDRHHRCGPKTLPAIV